MVSDKNHRTMQVRKEDYDYVNKIRKTPMGNLSYAEIFHNIVEFFKENGE